MTHETRTSNHAEQSTSTKKTGSHEDPSRRGPITEGTRPDAGDQLIWDTCHRLLFVGKVLSAPKSAIQPFAPFLVAALKYAASVHSGDANDGDHAVAIEAAGAIQLRVGDFVSHRLEGKLGRKPVPFGKQFPVEHWPELLVRIGVGKRKAAQRRAASPSPTKDICPPPVNPDPSRSDTGAFVEPEAGCAPTSIEVPSHTEPGLDDNTFVVHVSKLRKWGEQPRWLIESVWRDAGVGIIGGPPKRNKTWLVLDMAVSVASGTPCLGKFTVGQTGPVLLYLAEDSEQDADERLRALCQSRGLDLDQLAIHFIRAPVFRLDTQADQKRLGDALARLRPKLLVFDPIVRLHRLDENALSQMSPLLGFLRDVQRAHNVAIVLVHHMSKRGSEGDLDGAGLRGSSDFHAWGDTNIYLRQVKKSDDKAVVKIEHRAAASIPAFTIVRTSEPTTHLEVLSEADETDEEGSISGPTISKSSGVKDTIVKVLEVANKPLTRDALRGMVGGRAETVSGALQELKAEGKARQQGREGWVLVRGQPDDLPVGGAEEDNDDDVA
jgi:hypothetical protein